MVAEASLPGPNTIQASPSLKSFNIVRASELPAWGISQVIYGAGGVGKTTLAVVGAADSEYGAPVLMVDAEGGARAVTHRKDVDVLRLRDFKELAGSSNSLLDTIRRDPKFPYQTVVLDNLSEIQVLSMRAITGPNLPTQADWNVNTTRMLNMIRGFRDIGAERSINMFFIAWDKKDEDQQTGLVRRELAFNPALAGQVPGIVDMVGYLSMAPTGETRILSFAASQKTQAKFRRDQSEAAKSIPLTLAYKPGDPIMVDILATLKGGKPFPALKYANVPTSGPPRPAQTKEVEAKEEK